MSKKTDLAWLAAIIDGEGFVGLYKKNIDKRFYHIAKVGMANNNISIINNIRRILNENYIKYSVSITEANKYINKKDVYNIQIQSLESVKKILRLVSPYMLHSEKSKRVYEILFFDYEKRIDGKQSNRKKMFMPVQGDLWA